VNLAEHDAEDLSIDTRDRFVSRLTDGPIPVCHVSFIAALVSQKPLHGMQVESMPRQEATCKMGTVGRDELKLAVVTQKNLREPVGSVHVSTKTT
jgi:hypothetical protein